MKFKNLNLKRTFAIISTAILVFLLQAVKSVKVANLKKIEVFVMTMKHQH